MSTKKKKAIDLCFDNSRWTVEIEENEKGEWKKKCFDSLFRVMEENEILFNDDDEVVDIALTINRSKRI